MNRTFIAAVHGLDNDKILATVALIFIALASIIIAATPRATGFEISIYDAYPWYFWFFLICAIACGIYILVHQAFAEKTSCWWISGFFIILSANLIILLLPIFRLYAASRRYDTLTHIGLIKDIFYSGHIGYGNFYPITHILVVNTSYVTGLKLELLVMLLPTIFFLFYVVSLHLFSRIAAMNFSQALLITAFGSLLLFRDLNSMFFPSLQCFQLVPFVMFLLFRSKSNDSNSIAYSFMLIVILFMVPFTHPGEGSLFLLFILVCLALTPALLQRVRMPSGSHINTFDLGFKNMIRVVGILYVVWFAWFSSFAIINKSISAVYNWLVLNVGSSTLNIYTESYSVTLDKAGLTYVQIIDLFVKMYGQFALYFLASLLIGILYWYKFIFTPQKVSQNGITFTFLFTSLGISTVAFLAVYAHTSFTRNINWLLFAVTVLNGAGFYEFLNNKKGSTCLVCLFLISSTTVGLFNTFPSPIIYDNYFHATQMDFVGTDWFLEHQNDEYSNIWLRHALMRFSHAIVGYNEIPPNVLESNMFNPPDHFGYNENEAFGMSFAKDMYFVDSQISRTVPLVFSKYKHLLKITSEDVSNLENNDYSADIIYFNGEFWVFYIQGLAVQPSAKL